MNKLDRRNMIFFGLGTIGRDMFYAFEANALIYYLSNVLSLPLGVFLATSMVFTVLRVFDALNDPLMGLLVDNTRSRHGRFKPPMALGALAGGACYLVLFADFGLRDYWFVAVFAIAYILWDIFYGLNDIAYWSMLPSLSVEQKTREKMGAFARICANIGMFSIMVGWEPITSGMGNTPKAWFTVHSPLPFSCCCSSSSHCSVSGNARICSGARRKKPPCVACGKSSPKTISSCGPPLPCHSLISAT